LILQVAGQVPAAELMIQHNVQWKETELIISPVNFFEECRWRETLAPHLPNLKKNERARRSRQRRRNGAPSVKTQLKEELDARHLSLQGAQLSRMTMKASRKG
jgi:hypothetical protein